MTDQEFRDGARAAAQSIHMLAATRLAEAAADPSTDLDTVRKIYGDTKDVAGAVPEKKLDPNAGLATFNITFINGAMQATIEPATLDLEMVEIVRSELDALAVLPTQAMLAAAHINADLEGLIDG